MIVLRRVIMVFFGLLVGVAAGLILLPVAIALDPTARQAATALADFAFSSMVESSADPVFAAIELTRFVWSALVAVCIAPLAITVLVGETAQARSLLWYVGGTGLLAASAPWVARAAFNTTRMFSASPDELRFALPFFLTGAFSGLVYWALCGPRRRK
jgi:hypothetical protein